MVPTLLLPDWEPGLSWLLPAMSLGMSGLGGRGKGGPPWSSAPPTSGKMGGVGGAPREMEELFGCTHGLEGRGRAESGAWGT